MAAKKRTAAEEVVKNHLKLRDFQPLSDNQERVFNSYYTDKQLLLTGAAGSGKTFLAVYLALKEILEGDSNYKELIIVRSAVQSRNLGFTPGSVEEKAKVYEQVYKGIVDELFGRSDSYYILRNKEVIDFQTTSFLRGTSFNNSIVILDEAQNCNFTELETVITRIGHNSRIIICGDYRQTDLNGPNDKTGIIKFQNILKTMYSFDVIEFGIEDVVRSGLVKEYLLASMNYEKNS